MPEQTLTTLMEQLATAVMMADAADPTSLHEIVRLIGRLEPLTTTAGARYPSGELFARCRDLVAEIVDGRATEVDTTLDQMIEAVSSLQQMVAKIAREMAASAPVSATESPPKTLPADEQRDKSGEPPPNEAAPNGVDPELLREFVASGRVALGEIRQDIQALRQGEGARSEVLRKRLRSLANEAEMAGLGSLITLCRTADKLLAVDLGPDRHAEQLTQVTSRLLSALDGYEKGGQASAGCLEAGLEATAETALAQPSGGAAAAQTASPDQKSTVGPPAPTSPPYKAPTPVPAAASGPVDVDLVSAFIEECAEGLTAADQILLDIEAGAEDAEKINSLFRVFHTIKGTAAFIELEQGVSLGHTTEALLERVRSGELKLGGGLLDLVFDATAMMQNLLNELRRATEVGEAVQPIKGLVGLVERIKVATESGSVPDPLAESVPPEAVSDAVSKESAPAAPALPDEPERKTAAEAEAGGCHDPTPPPAAKKGSEQPAPAAAACTTGAPASSAKVAQKVKASVRVDLDRVDRLVETVGELVIVESLVAAAPEITELSSPRIRNYLSQLTKITRDLQDISIRMRMVPLRAVFHNMASMVRNLARKSGKSVTAVLSGEWTEMDRSMVEQMRDPLTHIIRNAVDHGIETAQGRQAAGKPGRGEIRIAARHEGSSIIVQVSDDGRGLNADAIYDKAVKQGILSEGEQLSELEIYHLIFAPGFSTASTVTEISGRGVGMDVVKRSIDAMRGRIQVQSSPGRGTTFTMALPLTLAIIDGMLVSCGAEHCIIPTLSTVESIRPSAAMLATMAGSQELINLRGTVLPLLRLARLLDIPGATADPTEAIVVVVESLGRKVGLMVDEVITQQQVVIKSFDLGPQKARFFSGAAILSDGKVGLILDPDELTSLAKSLAREATQEQRRQQHAYL